MGLNLAKEKKNYGRTNEIHVNASKLIGKENLKSHIHSFIPKMKEDGRDREKHKKKENRYECLEIK